MLSGIFFWVGYVVFLALLDLALCALCSLGGEGGGENEEGGGERVGEKE